MTPLRLRVFPWLWLLLALASACQCNDYTVCDAPAPARLSVLPARLSETGLFADVKAGTLAPGVRAFRPQFELWSDGAAKRRWVALPEGGRIDTSDMDAWRFPVGTRLWKEFTRDGVRVETRLLLKFGPGERDWADGAYLWTADGADAVLTPAGAKDVLGTKHDVPTAAQCDACHGGRSSHVLGFSAIQLAHDAGPGLLNLDGLVAEGLLTAPPREVPRVPGNATERAALGYLHANCGSCHNLARPSQGGSRCFAPQNELDFWLQVDRLSSPSATPTYASFERGVQPGAPEDSLLLVLMARRGPGVRMPPLATEVVDHDAMALLHRWVEQLPE
ncbi:hypothetical protein [Pyxidicoccus xibeiensis]|uniref:hypothetical protein n=1 Tax=Pyxidicoccus xibeiensis TaxID=2906759 RepID=UPI0020A7B518|nr:hypothetical protein [Pyxidicoccus xibeiensis]MCP3143979.1 hypothetical protein [Pyxidicoccus xibeiensis]